MKHASQTRDRFGLSFLTLLTSLIDNSIADKMVLTFSEMENLSRVDRSWHRAVLRAVHSGYDDYLRDRSQDRLLMPPFLVRSPFCLVVLSPFNSLSIISSICFRPARPLVAPWWSSLLSILCDSQRALRVTVSFYWLLVSSGFLRALPA